MAFTVKTGTNYTSSFVTVPSSKNNGENGAPVRKLWESFTLDADAAASETVIMGRLPAGAKVIMCRLYGPDLGGTGTIEVGNSVSVDGSATDALDVDSFIDAVDSSGQAFDTSDNSSAANRGPAIGLIRFSTEVNVILTFTGATSGATAKIIYLDLSYIVE
jgi:hypothetical protein